MDVWGYVMPIYVCVCVPLGMVIIYSYICVFLWCLCVCLAEYVLVCLPMYTQLSVYVDACGKYMYT